MTRDSEIPQLDRVRSGPWWVRFVERFGVPTAVALALGFIIIKMWTGDTSATAADVRAMRVMQSEHHATTERLEKMMSELVRLERLKCLKDATTDADRSDCLGR